MEKLNTSKTFLKMAGTDAYPSSYPPRSAPGHKLHKPSKESGNFSYLARLILFFFIKRQSQRGGGGHGPMPPLNTLLTGTRKGVQSLGLQAIRNSKMNQ